MHPGVETLVHNKLTAHLCTAPKELVEGVPQALLAAEWASTIVIVWPQVWPSPSLTNGRRYDPLAAGYLTLLGAGHLAVHLLQQQGHKGCSMYASTHQAFLASMAKVPSPVEACWIVDWCKRCSKT
mmetsp:Transcript_54518/g.100881  ORF Transcript_54518/g.100881 Transcript_54518/m.100881 type:complete len:126 (+) Transcript_54518:815-1192(+)